MKAVVFDVTIPGYLMAKGLGGVTDSVLFGAPSGVSMRDLPEPVIPGPGWVRLKVLAGGICGTDVGNLSFKSSTAMEPFGSFPAVLGHEILARVEEVGEGVTRVHPGQRVAVDPIVSCTARGFAAGEGCPSCEAGLHATCERAGEDGVLEFKGQPMARGLTMGYHRDLPGGWGEVMIAHESHVFPVSDELTDRTAVLIEPLSIAVHAVLGTAIPAGPVLVIGSGPIALGTIWALRATGFTGEIVSQTKRPHEAAMARAFGASDVVSPGDEARDALVRTGAMAYQPIVGDEVYSGGGYPLVFDCVGNRSSLTQSMRFAAARGMVVMLGCAGEIPKLDLTFIWARELNLKGFVGYGAEAWRGERRHTFEVTHQLLLETRAPLADMVTHVFPLSQYKDGLAKASNHRKSKAVKVLLTP